MHILKRGARTLLAPFGGNRQCTIMQHPAVAPVTLDDAVARRSRCGGVNAKYSNGLFVPSACWSYAAHRTKSTAFRAALPALCAAHAIKRSARQEKRPVRDADWPRKILQR